MLEQPVEAALTGLDLNPLLIPFLISQDNWSIVIITESAAT